MLGLGVMRGRPDEDGSQPGDFALAHQWGYNLSKKRLRTVRIQVPHHLLELRTIRVVIR